MRRVAALATQIQVRVAALATQIQARSVYCAQAEASARLDRFARFDLRWSRFGHRLFVDLRAR
jgi:hypothetical protein